MNQENKSPNVINPSKEALELSIQIFKAGGYHGDRDSIDARSGAFLIDKLISQAKENERKRIYDDWETAIRYSQNDEDEVPIEKRRLSELVMTNHLNMSKEQSLASLSERKEK